MAITNFTGGGNQTETFAQFLCSAGVKEGIHQHLIYISVINIFLSITAFLGNTLILVTLRKESSLHPPSKLLFSCLATTDLCIGLIAEPLIVTYWLSLVHEKWNICRYSLDSCFIAGYSFGLVSLLTLAVISVDRLLALSFGMRYRQVVTLKRTYMAVVTFWIMATIGSTSYLGNHLITFWSDFLFSSHCVIIKHKYKTMFIKNNRAKQFHWT